jgi:hypothetical protein
MLHAINLVFESFHFTSVGRSNVFLERAALILLANWRTALSAASVGSSLEVLSGSSDSCLLNGFVDTAFLLTFFETI